MANGRHHSVNSRGGYAATPGCSVTPGPPNSAPTTDTGFGGRLRAFVGRMPLRLSAHLSVRRPARNLLLTLLATSWLVPLGANGASTERPDDALRALLQHAVKRADSFDDRFDAEVWLLDMSTRLSPIITDAEHRLHILRAVHREATKAELEPALVLSVITVESRFDRFALSHAGARGLMQIMPFWLEEIGQPEANLFTVDTNLAIGCTILKHYIDREKGHLQRALARYNGSLGKYWYPNRVMKAYRKYWSP